MTRDTTVIVIAAAVLAACVCLLPPAVRAQARARPADIRPVPSGPAVSLAEMQASCAADAVGRTAGGRKDAAFSPRMAGAAPVLAGLTSVFADWLPNGFETQTGGSLPDPDLGMPAHMRPWQFYVLGYPYYCVSESKFDRDGHYAFSAYLSINTGLGSGPFALPFDFDPDSRNGDGTSNDSKLGFYSLWAAWLVDGLPQPKNGYFHFPGDYEDVYWFTRGGQLPFQYVSREEFLRKQIGILTKDLAHYREGLARIEAIAGQPVDPTVTTSFIGLMYDKPIARYQQWLNNPAAWLQQPAVMRMTQRPDEMSYEFLEPTQAGPDVVVPIKPNPAYFDPSKPAGAPQYLVILMRNQYKRGEYYQLRDLIDRNVDTFKSLVN